MLRLGTKWTLLLLVLLGTLLFYAFKLSGKQDVEMQKVVSTELFSPHDLKQLQKSYKFVILVYAWKRRASLKRLCDSLKAANYRGFSVNLEFHVEGDPHPLVIQYINSFQWPNGEKRLKRKNTRAGLEASIMESWNAADDRELGMMFEDDIEVSPLYFDYILLTLKNYLLGTPKNSDALVGISLTTPRFNEVNIPHRMFLPDYYIGKQEKMYAHQLPCSWGAVYFPWEWRKFLEFYHWRKTKGPNEELGTVPHGFLVEWMLMEGKAMLYPSLPNQVSFSTHHREPGEHTHAVGQVPIVDDMTKHKVYHFTVPLALNTSSLLDFAHTKPLDELPILNFYHEKMTDLDGLKQTGLPLVRTFKDYPPIAARISQQRCFLDIASSRKPSSSLGKKWITFEPQGSILDQLEQIKSLSAIGRILNRDVLMPRLNLENVRMNINRVIDTNITSVPDLNNTRVAVIQKIEESGINRSGSASHVYFPLLAASEAEIKQWFGTCNDNPLVINRADLIYPIADVDATHADLKDTAHDAVREWMNDYTCVDFSRPSKKICKSLSLVADWKTFYEANCNKTILEQYVLSGKIYAVAEDGTSSEAVVVRDSTKNLIPVYKRTFLVERLVKHYRDIRWPALIELSKLVEEEICVMAPRFIGSPYSLATQRIIAKRERFGKRCEIVGRK